MLKLVLSFSLLLTAETLLAQQVEFSAAAGPVVPIGKDLSKPYSLGFGMSAGPRINMKDVFILPEVQGKLFINNPSSSVKDNLLLYGGSVKLGYGFLIKGLKIEPMAGVGYGWGTNFLTNRAADFSGGYFNKKIDLIKLNGVNYNFGVVVFFKEKFGVGIQYQVYQATATPTTDAQVVYPSYNSSTQLYGKLVSFPDQKMSLDNLLIHFSIKL